ncbi:hypothetical protein QTO34_009986 [Cnephaeus nilssonii]|uniref:Uncharacterized protein n=1 Tax=Cnephaeus nilssonii TaxID=3371016 RepID=A0AA40LFL8_CNENI|nr:hypothetical protein QTO34_009986 [Eptesicus nilssonii]
MEKSLINAVNVGNRLRRCIAFIVIRDFTLEKGLMSAVNVGILLPVVLPFVVIRDFTQEERLTNAVNVGNLLRELIAFIITRDFTLEKVLMSAVNVGNLLPGAMPFVVIREATQGKNLINAVSVGNLLPPAVSFVVIREFTQEKSLIIAVNVGNLSQELIAFIVIRDFTPEKVRMSAVNRHEDYPLSLECGTGERNLIPLVHLFSLHLSACLHGPEKQQNQTSDAVAATGPAFTAQVTQQDHFRAFATQSLDVSPEDVAFHTPAVMISVFSTGVMCKVTRHPAFGRTVRPKAGRLVTLVMWGGEKNADPFLGLNDYITQNTLCGIPTA